MSEENDAARFVEELDAWVREQQLQDVLPREEVLELIREVRADDAFWERVKPRYQEAWDRVDERLRKEARPLKEILSEKTVKKVLDGVEKFEPDPEVIRHFLRSPAIEETLGNVLYVGIFEFMKKVDIFGKIINKLPVLGPIRRRIMSAFKDQLEGQLEAQIKSFLGGFSGLAVERMIQFVLSEESRPKFQKARRRMAEHLLSRPLQSLLPDAKTAGKVRDDVWSGLREPAVRDEEQFFTDVYQDHGQTKVDSWLRKLTPRGRDLLAQPFERFLETEWGRGWRSGG